MLKDAKAGGAAKWFENHSVPWREYFLCKTDKDPARTGKAQEFVADLKLESEFVSFGIPHCRQDGTGRPHLWEVKVSCCAPWSNL